MVKVRLTGNQQYIALLWRDSNEKLLVSVFLCWCVFFLCSHVTIASNHIQKERRLVGWCYFGFCGSSYSLRYAVDQTLTPTLIRTYRLYLDSRTQCLVLDCYGFCCSPSTTALKHMRWPLDEREMCKNSIGLCVGFVHLISSLYTVWFFQTSLCLSDASFPHISICICMYC